MNIKKIILERRKKSNRNFLLAFSPCEWFGRSCTETLTETIESDPLRITDLFQNKSVAYFLSIITFLQIFLYVS